MLTYKKRRGDLPSTGVKDREHLLAMWEGRKDRTSPTCSDNEMDEVDIKVEDDPESAAIIDTDGTRIALPPVTDPGVDDGFV